MVRKRSAVQICASAQEGATLEKRVVLCYDASNMIKARTFLVILAVALLVLDVGLYFSHISGRALQERRSSGLLVAGSALYVAEQLPSKTLAVSFVIMEKPGFIVVHEDKNDAPGNVIGSSIILPRGEQDKLPPIKLSRKTIDGETLYAMLHADNGDGIFNKNQDQPIVDAVTKEPMMMVVVISNDATTGPGIINL